MGTRHNSEPEYLYRNAYYDEHDLRGPERKQHDCRERDEPSGKH